MKHASVLFLQLTVFLMGLPALAACVIGVIGLLQNNPDQFPGKMHPTDIGFFVAVIPYFIALFQAYRLLGYIDKSIAFSELSVQALKKIKICGYSISLIFLVMEPVLYVEAMQEDAPGLIVLGLAVVFASFIIAVFAALLARLLHNAIQLQSENDLTV
ncbi:DUF2975 domain-containing protein [Paenibacillus glycanilyticus]|uniref:DUF2975 domain-containing protein n=1 Tax=Paenibacillus glycanilyticus TaxID=126569 RepID=A0ABQ6GB35_9BACL|nr:DUF2975 domain-containing protein [Paenibacillus glycanilyticus]GLX66816.1 hypothetical protein MU1_11600 [Paenibacillus glycanilyticus]